MSQNSIGDTESGSLEIQSRGGPFAKLPPKFQKLWIFKILFRIYRNLLINLSELPNAEVFRARYSKDWKLGSTWLAVLFISAIFWLIAGLFMLYFLI